MPTHHSATSMARLSIAPSVVMKVLNHATGQISGVAADYNRYGYDEEKRAALNAWARAVEATLLHDDIKVIPIRAGSSDD